MPTYAETIVENLKDKLVQIYFGDSYEETHYDDSSRNIPAVIIGKVIGGAAECIILDCLYLDDNKERRFGNIQYINPYNIQAITEIDGRGTIKDAIDSAHSSKNFSDL